MVFVRLAYSCEETCESVWLPNAGLYASSTCRYLRLLASPFDQSFKPWPNEVAISRKWTQVYLRGDLRWVAKRTRKFSHKYTQVTKKPFQGRHILYFIG